MARSLHYPHAPIAEEVNGLLKWTKALLFAFYLGAVLCGFLWMEKIGIPFPHLVVWFVVELARSAVRKFAGSEISDSPWKHALDRP